MSDKQLIHRYYDELEIKYAKSDSYLKLADRLDVEGAPEIKIDELRNYFRSKWKPAPTDLHLKNLKTGLLNGHNWHGAMPSMLHLSMQERVRDCIEGKIALENLISIGADIMKHEYFMVATHDLLETIIIENFDDAIPPIGKKSISDFVFNGIPYDMKNTNYFSNWTRESVNENKKQVAQELISGADISRIRKQAEGSINGWGLNRFYIMVEDQELWLREPEKILQLVLNEAEKLADPFDVEVENNITFKAQLIAI